MDTLKKLADYEKALREWKERDGLKGGGGKYIRTGFATGRYEKSPEPAFICSDPFTVKMAAQIKAKVLA